MDLSEENLWDMRKFHFQSENDLQKAILEIIGTYEAVMAEDIYFELGEDDQFRNAVSLPEVNEALSLLEGKKIIHQGKDEKWRFFLE